MQELRASEKSSAPTGAAVPAVHRLHREEFARFVLEQAEPWHREHLTRPHAAWHTL